MLYKKKEENRFMLDSFVLRGHMLPVDNVEVESLGLKLFFTPQIEIIDNGVPVPLSISLLINTHLFNKFPFLKTDKNKNKKPHLDSKLWI